MKRGDLLKYAEVGIRQRLIEIEREANTLHREFPNLFIGPPPVFVKAELKSATTRRAKAAKSSWTPARRRAQAERMRKRMRALHGEKGHS